MELLVEKAEAAEKSFVPPRIMTAGSLPELFYESSRRTASPFERHLAWLQAFNSADAESMQLVLPRPPAKDNLPAWFLLAQRIDALYADIASGGHTFHTVADHCAKGGDFFADERWNVLATIYSSFLSSLSEHDLGDVHSERIAALKEKRCEFRGEIILTAASDLPLITRKMLSGSDTRVSVLIHAPEKLSGMFDTLGCLDAPKWSEFDLSIPDAAIKFSRGPAEQAAKVISCIAEFNGKLPPEEISLCACSKTSKPFIIEALTERKLPTRDASGSPLERTAPFAFLRLASAYLSSKSFSDFAALVRHPDVHAALINSAELKSTTKISAGILAELDSYQQKHLQGALESDLPGSRPKGHIPTLARQVLHKLLGELTEGPRNLAAWSPILAQALVTLFGSRQLNPHIERDALILSACASLHEEISLLYAFSPSKNVKISAADAIRLVLSQLYGKSLELSDPEPAIEVLGWLELHLDDAAAAIVTGFNEGDVPDTVSSDPFLPNSLRSALGLLDNVRRYARDAYALSAILKSRKYCSILASRIDSTGNSINPSRLLFACPGKKIAERIQNFYEATRDISGQISEGQGEIAVIAPPKPEILEPAPTSMSVTGFKDYLECPYRYYLKHIVKLRSLDDESLELDGAAAGTLFHSVLTAFGQSTARHETSAKKISDFLLDTLAQKFSEDFGRSALPAVHIQRLQAEDRLQHFSNWQARWAAEGWEIKHSELTVDSGKSYLELPKGGKMEIQGRIDRIDYHPGRKEWFVFDYQTGEKGRTPDETHRLRGEWIDLQLPLYKHLLLQMGIAEPIRLGFILLPADPQLLGEKEASWVAGEIDSALQTAKSVAQLVHDQVFWPPNNLRRNTIDDYRLLVPEDFTAAESEGAAR
jgi:hypothetical protein